MANIDHIYSVVESLDDASALLRRLGFTVSPRGYHAGRGTANHLVVFSNAYWELLGFGGEGPASEVRAVVAERPGLAGCAIATDDIEHDRMRLEQLGVCVAEAVALRRPVAVDGQILEAKFVTAKLAAQWHLAADLFLCQHLTPDLVWTPQAVRHENGAETLRELVIVGDNADLAGKYLDGILGARGSDPLKLTTLRRDQFEARFLSPAPRTAFRSSALGAICMTGVDFDRASVGSIPGIEMIDCRDGFVLKSPALGQSLLCIQNGSTASLHPLSEEV